MRSYFVVLAAPQVQSGLLRPRVHLNLGRNFRRDIPVLQGTVLVLASFFVMINLLVDVLQALIDPRMRR